MTKKHRRGKYEKIVEWALKYYERWRKERTVCPAFDGQEVLITRIGWSHLISSRFRTKVEKIERLKALPLAKKLIKKSNTYQEYRFKNGLHYYAIEANLDGAKIKVVLSSKTKKGKKNFLSVMVLRRV